jgi:hypothetical protein
VRPCTTLSCSQEDIIELYHDPRPYTTLSRSQENIIELYHDLRSCTTLSCSQKNKAGGKERGDREYGEERRQFVAAY